MPYISLEYDIIPCPKPRMTQRDRWKKRPVVERYYAFKDAIREAGITIPECNCKITFILPMPKSWSEKKKFEMDGRPHQQTPDADNMGKGILDSVFKEDCRIWDIRFTKRWGRSGKIIVRVKE